MYFLYAIPPQAGLNQEVLNKFGLGHLPPANTLIQRGMMTGPGDAACTMIADGRCKAEDLYYKPAEQVWEKSLHEKFWIGYWVDRMPGPGQLARPQQIDGYELDLGDRGKWRIPLARKFPIGTALPQGLILTADGVTLRELPQYVEFCAKAERLWRQFCRQMDWAEADANDDLTVEEEAWICVEALRLNYYTGVDEVNALGLLDTNNLQEIACRIVDVPGLERALVKRLEQVKKKQKFRRGEIERIITRRMWRGGRLGDYWPTFGEFMNVLVE